MKNIITFFILIISIILIFSSCGVNDSEITGRYIEVIVSGNYFDENTGNMTTQSEELRAVVNLYPESSGKMISGGAFPNNQQGLLFSAKGGFTNVSTSSAHVNGFITKGPFENGSTVNVRLLDENLDPLDFGEFSTELETNTDEISTFSLNIPSTNDVDINININALSTIQAHQIYNLAENGMSFAEAHDFSKQEILDLLDLSSSSEFIEDFEKMDIRQDTESNQVLLVASSIMAQEYSSTKQSGTIFDEIMNQILNNGTVYNEILADTIKEKALSLDLETIIDNLSNYFDNVGGDFDYTTPPDVSSLMDSDGDGIVDKYDITLVGPIGEYEPGTEPTEFSWTAPGLEAETDVTVSFVLQLSESRFFEAAKTISLNTSNYSYPILMEEEGQRDINYSTHYFWRIGAVINGEMKGWAASSAFYVYDYVPSPTIPSGYIELLSGYSSPSKQYIIDNSQIYAYPHQMRFSLESTFTGVDWMPFELTYGGIVPLSGTIIYAQFENQNGGIYDTNITISSVDNPPIPSGSLMVNENPFSSQMDGNTLYDELLINMGYGDTNFYIDNAFKMRFSVDGVFDSAEELEWKPFQTRYTLDIPSNLSSGSHNLTAEFANSAGISEPITGTFNKLDYYTITFVIGDYSAIILSADPGPSSEPYGEYEPIRLCTRLGSPHAFRFENGEDVQLQDYNYNIDHWNSNSGTAITDLGEGFWSFIVDRNDTLTAVPFTK